MKKLINKALGLVGLKLERADHLRKLPADMQEPEFQELYEKCKPYTMTSPERLYALFKAMEYVVGAKLPGDFVECGVWKGGSAMLMAYYLKKRGITDRKIYLYDTFEGMSEPSNFDKSLDGKTAAEQLNSSSKADQDSVWCYSSLDEVKQNLQKTGYPSEQLHFAKGKVEDTLPGQNPQGPLALLRLDTDWYESTRHELLHLYPLLQTAGVLIVDDYGHWQGCRKAVDEYFAEHQIQMLLQRIDYTGRLGLKP
jgi:hypothetical protein